MLNEIFLRFLSIGDLGPIWLGSDQQELIDHLGPSTVMSSGEPASWQYGNCDYLIEQQTVIGIELSMESCRSGAPGADVFGIPAPILQQLARMSPKELQTWLHSVAILHSTTDQPSYDPATTIIRTSSRSRFVFQNDVLQTISALLPRHAPTIPSHKEFPAEFLQADPEVIVFDIDGFVWFNDQLGFTRGNAIIGFVSETMQFLAAQMQMRAYRVGGDEYLMTGPKNRDLAAAASRVISAFRLSGLAVKRPDRPTQSPFAVNAAIVRLNRERFSNWFGIHGVTPVLRELLWSAFDAEKTASGAECGVMADLRDMTDI